MDDKGHLDFLCLYCIEKKRGINMERVQYNAAFFRSRPFSFVFFGWSVFPLIFWYVQSLSNKIILEGNTILYEVGILSKNRTEIEIDKIRTIKVVQSLSDRIFGAGDIELYTSGDDPEIILRGFPSPNVIKDALKNTKDV